MSRNIIKAHATMALLASVALTAASLGEPQQIKEALTTDKVYERIVLRVTADFEHGEKQAESQKFGGFYNIIKGAHVLFNSNDKTFVKSGLGLYLDNFKRQGRELNDLNYENLPASHTQNIDYCFKGNESIVGGAIVSDSIFALDLRHSQAAGVNTFNSVELVLDIDTLGAVFSAVNDTALKALKIEVFGVELFHDTTSLKTLAANNSRYGHVIANTDVIKVVDNGLVNEVNLPAIGTAKDGVNLSDLAVVQTDENGMPVPFDDENAVVRVQVSEFDFYNYPVWEIRRLQNLRRVEAVPPNVLILPMAQVATRQGGLSPTMLEQGATLFVKSNKVDGQTGETCLHVEKNYTSKKFG